MYFNPHTNEKYHNLSCVRPALVIPPSHYPPLFIQQNPLQPHHKLPQPKDLRASFPPSLINLSRIGFLSGLTAIKWRERQQSPSTTTHHSLAAEMKRCPYATLNVHRVECAAGHVPSVHQVSDNEIREAYKRLSRIFHPDQRPPGKEREDAQEVFTELMNSCE
jgi:hypothetical protein